MEISVSSVSLIFRVALPTPLHHMHLLPTYDKGSMLPKVEAAIAFVNGRPEGKAVITSLENLGALIESESGTIIEKG